MLSAEPWKNNTYWPRSKKSVEIWRKLKPLTVDEIMQHTQEEFKCDIYSSAHVIKHDDKSNMSQG